MAIKKGKVSSYGAVQNYAFVKDRLKEFRIDSPRGDIKTEFIILDDGNVSFKATIIKDRADENSPRATGSSLGNSKDKKGFEKLETIAVGRALAFLGYVADGDIASAEEIEEYEKRLKETEAIAKRNAIDAIDDAKTIDDLKDVWASLDPKTKIIEDVLASKEAKKVELTDVTKA